MSIEVPTQKGATLEEFLCAAPGMVTDIVEARQNSGHHNVYDRFITDYVGDFQVPRAPAIVRNDARDSRIFDGEGHSSYTTEGHLLHVRLPKKIHAYGEARNNFFVAIANVHTGVITEWEVDDVHHDSHEGTFKTTIYLKSDLLEYDVDLRRPKNMGDAVKNAKEYHRRKGMIALMQQQRARIELSNKGGTFRPFDSREETLRPFLDLTESLDRLHRQFHDASDLHASRRLSSPAIVAV